MSEDDGIRSCRFCIWDIRQDAEGKWKLAWMIDKDLDPLPLRVPLRP
jgi:hypothetical protein